LHEFNGLDRVGISGHKNSLVAVAVVTAVGAGSAGCVVAMVATDTGNKGKDSGKSSIGEVLSQVCDKEHETTRIQLAQAIHNSLCNYSTSDQ
jgi:hypothetical protein